jgi:hypothetical protein
VPPTVHLILSLENPLRDTARLGYWPVPCGGLDRGALMRGVDLPPWGAPILCLALGVDPPSCGRRPERAAWTQSASGWPRATSQLRPRSSGTKRLVGGGTRCCFRGLHRRPFLQRSSLAHIGSAPEPQQIAYKEFVRRLFRSCAKIGREARRAFAKPISVAPQ